MKRPPQTAWAIVGFNGWINHSTIRFTRRDVIADQVAEWRKYSSMAKHADLSDSQFWRIIKRRRNCRVARVALRVVK